MLWGLTLRHLISKGFLRVIDARGREHRYGVEGESPSVSIKLHDPKLHYRLFYNPRFYAGEAYMNGTLTFSEGSLRDFFTLVSINLNEQTASLPMRLHIAWSKVLRFVQQYNPAKRARKNVAHHYDLNIKLYEKFLDKDLQYSCAYFLSESDTLEEAQLYKKRHIAAKLGIEPGMKVLDIGCGFGGMALFLAREFGAHVTGLTLSSEQLLKAQSRAREAGLDKMVEFHLRDYRDEQGEYDRIVSVGMFEHVGVVHYETFFNKIKTLLKPDGVALLHAIGRMDGPGATNPWLQKYIFPGGYSPALSEVLAPFEQSGLWATDIEILRMHYAWTLNHWHKRFEAARPSIAQMYDERFCRMWEFYLIAAEMEFLYNGAMVFQIQITRDIAALPFTRDYLFECERALCTSQKLSAPRRYAVH